MMTRFDVASGTTLYVPFHTFGASGESITLTGLAVTDIEIFKNGSVTQRASDNGYTLLDTDGIDFDSRTGLHGFSIDLSDNSDSGFFAVGSEYFVAVDAVTVNSQTVRFWACWFRIVAAESTAGYPNVTIKSGTGTGEVSLSSGTVTVGTNNDKTGYALTSGERNSVADALLDRDMSTGADNGSTTVRTVRQALRFLRNKWSISGTTLTVCKEDDSTTSWSSTLTSSASADPVTASDPAGP